MNYLILAEGGFLDTIEILKQYGPFCGILVWHASFSSGATGNAKTS
jgi:hypothetical protein